MKKLIVVRHAPYGNDDRINEWGREVTDMLIERLKSLVTGQKVRILTSTEDRAKDTADIIARELNTSPPEAHEVLWSENKHPMNLPAALLLIQKYQDETEVLIIITHLEYAEVLSKHYGDKVLGKHVPAQYDIQKGEATVLNCENGEMEYLKLFN